MLWNEPKKLADGTREARRGQPQSSVEYATWCEHFPDPHAPSTHAVVYHWEDSPNRGAPRVLVIGVPAKTEAGLPAEVKPEAPQANESRRKELAAMSGQDLDTAYGIAMGASMPKNINKSKAIAQILEAEAIAT